MNTVQLVEMIAAIRDALAAERDPLNTLDGALGDGDHGSSLSAAFAKAVEQLHRSDAEVPSDVLRITATALMNTMGGASGALYGTMFLRASAAVTGETKLTVVDVAGMWQAGLDGVIQRGKAEAGGKTMIDALLPAVEALKSSAETGSLTDAFCAAADAAHTGAEATAHMVAQFGRAKFTGERARGHIDAGAASTAIMFRAMRDYWRGQHDGEA